MEKCQRRRRESFGRLGEALKPLIPITGLVEVASPIPGTGILARAFGQTVGGCIYFGCVESEVLMELPYGESQLVHRCDGRSTLQAVGLCLRVFRDLRISECLNLSYQGTEEQLLFCSLLTRIQQTAPRVTARG